MCRFLEISKHIAQLRLLDLLEVEAEREAGRVSGSDHRGIGIGARRDAKWVVIASALA